MHSDIRFRGPIIRPRNQHSTSRVYFQRIELYWEAESGSVNGRAIARPSMVPRAGPSRVPPRYTGPGTYMCAHRCAETILVSRGTRAKLLRPVRGPFGARYAAATLYRGVGESRAITIANSPGIMSVTGRIYASHGSFFILAIGDRSVTSSAEQQVQRDRFLRTRRSAGDRGVPVSLRPWCFLDLFLHGRRTALIFSVDAILIDLEIDELSGIGCQLTGFMWWQEAKCFC